MGSREPSIAHTKSHVDAPAVCHIYQCQTPACGLRYPVPVPQPSIPREESPAGQAACARCGGPVTIVSENGPRGVAPASAMPFPRGNCMPESTTSRAEGLRLAGLLDNLRSAFNVGSIFRIADGAGFAHVHVCGISATPQQAKVRKTALGAENAMPWSYHANALHAAEALHAQGWWLVALETGPEAHTLFASGHHIPPERPIALMVGNEVCGLDPGLLKLADTVLEIPMLGHKESLNVAVAFGIAAYWLRGMPQAAQPPIYPAGT